MRRINPTIHGKRFEQVSKPTARRLFTQGREIYLNPCLMMPGNIWQSLCPIRLDPDRIPTLEKDASEQFRHTVNSFEYYNCSSEAGNYANFYIEVTPEEIKGPGWKYKPYPQPEPFKPSKP